MTSSSRDGLADLALAVPLGADARAREDGQSVAHVHAIHLPQQLRRQWLALFVEPEVLLELRERGVAEQRRRLPPREGDAQRVSIAPRAGAALAPPAAPRLEPALRCGGAWLTTAFRSLAQRSESSARLILYSLASLAYLAVRDRG